MTGSASGNAAEQKKNFEVRGSNEEVRSRGLHFFILHSHLELRTSSFPLPCDRAVAPCAIRLRIGLVLGPSGLVLGPSGLIFRASGLIFEASGLVFGPSVLVLGPSGPGL